MTDRPELSPAHAQILALAKRAITVRDDRPAWKRNPDSAIAAHEESCNAVWKELEDQVAAQDGRLPVLEMPSVRQIRMAKRLRDEIIAAVQGAVVEALDDIISGALMGEVGRDDA